LCLFQRTIYKNYNDSSVSFIEGLKLIPHNTEPFFKIRERLREREKEREIMKKYIKHFKHSVRNPAIREGIYIGKETFIKPFT
jgi:hypothetical protein